MNSIEVHVQPDVHLTCGKCGINVTDYKSKSAIMYGFNEIIEDSLLNNAHDVEASNCVYIGDVEPDIDTIMLLCELCTSLLKVWVNVKPRKKKDS